MPIHRNFKNHNLVIIILSSLIILSSTQKPICGQDNKDVQDKQSQEDVIRVNSNLVSVPASVSDRDGRYITNLKKEDFQIFENGILQEVSFFEPVEQQFTVFLLLDVSGSMVYEMEGLADASSAFLNQLRPDDKISVATFADQVDVLFENNSVKDVKGSKKIKLRVIGLPPITMVYDAVKLALKKTSKIRGRKAIILFSDGIGSGYFASAKSTLRDAEEQEALIYTITFDTNSKVRSRYESEKAFQKRFEDAEFAKQYMGDLAAKTGGRNYQIEKITDLSQTFGAIAEELGRQYFLGYYPKLEAGRKRQVRQIKVKVKQPNLIVKARESYVVEPKK